MFENHLGKRRLPHKAKSSITVRFSSRVRVPGTERARPFICKPQDLCARCTMMKVVRYRFAAFRLKFGREPLPFEPLFFDEGRTDPVAEKKDRVLIQLAEAADATRVSLPRLLQFLNLDDQ